MKTKRLLSALILSCLLPPNVLADIYQDPKTKVNYEYTVGASTASVKAGDGRSFPDGTILDYAGSPDVTGDIVILSNFTIDGNEYTVTSIGGCAFLDCTGLTSVTIPNSVTSIGLSAFSGSGLTSVTIPNSVTSIGLAAFHSCSGLTSVTIPNSVTAIGLNTFRNCTGLTSITIPNSVTSIDNGAFKGCSGLTSIAIPNSVTSIGGGAFTGTGWYENQPDGILYLDNWLIDYKGAEPTGEIVIKEGTKGIADAVFYNCSGLTSITIPNSVANIGFAAFYITGWYNNQPDGILYLDNWLIGYKGEKPSGELVIKEGTKGTAASTFENCTGLTSITIPNSMTSIGRAAFYGCSGLTSVTIPNSVTIIRQSAFRRCSGLTSVTIPNSVTTIGRMAFESCSNLTSITIPNSVMTIGYSAFFGCTCLTSVTSLIIEPFEIADEVFQNYNNDTKSYNFTTATLFVPKGTKEKYEATAAWNKFQNIVEIEVSDQPKGDVNGDQTVDVADIASVIDCMAGSGAVDKAAADVNGDGTVDVADIATIIDIMAGKDGDTEPVIPEEKAYTICPDDNHPHMIDLGLSSGTRWACCNVGADTPEGYGSYYAWGETWTKINYDWITYAHCDGSFSNCHDIGSDISGTIYDTATVNWGTSWRMPTIDQYHELISSCSSTWINKDGINGLNITGANGSTIFMPASGCYRFSKMDGQNSYGIYWSSTKNPERTSAYFLHFDNDDVGWTFPDYGYREGRPVRPVR